MNEPAVSESCLFCGSVLGPSESYCSICELDYPEKTMLRIRELCCERNPCDHEQLIELIFALDLWLQMGGRPPAEWRRAISRARTVAARFKPFTVVRACPDCGTLFVGGGTLRCRYCADRLKTPPTPDLPPRGPADTPPIRLPFDEE